ncbi:pyruvate kinase-like protein [Immersiella caudata]|uniref:Pyruvate kinase-like protein n=1 Tax=Immersiella caudata TaxID=314043 RepID=A0AA39WF61_9PEZI|nr:pyruvate kinase-like protein [Immersiella caudata]
MTPQEAQVDLWAPFTSDVLLEVRSGQMKLLPGSTTLSAIDKSLIDGPVYVGADGIADDEHDLTFHGGPDKSILGFCSSHYATLRDEYPSAADKFQPGGHGENFVTERMNERNVCIGDIVAVGDELVLQVSLPRQPCFKLNQRFQLKNFASVTWKTSRTGWYYRTITTGTVKAGDSIRLVERKHPTWTVEKVQEYLHRNTEDAAMNEELAEIEALGAESRKEFQRRVAKQKAKERKARESLPKWRDFRVAERRQQTPRIVSFVLEAVEPLTDPREAKLKPGAHAKLKLGNGLVRAYSVVDGDRNRFQLGISLDDKSRGGSKYMHQIAQLGHIVQVGTMTEGIPLARAAGHHIFVAAGVGITAFLAQIEAVAELKWSMALHYAVRSAEEVPFCERLEKLGDRVIIYDKSLGQRLDIPGIIGGMKWNSHLYFCGPKRLMGEAAKETKARCVPESEVHFEAFEADISGDPFEAVVANRENKLLKVGEEESLLEVLQKHFDVDYSCSVGNCGTCRIGLKEGRVDHRGTALTEEEKTASMLSCVSRGVGRITVEI